MQRNLRQRNPVVPKPPKKLQKPNPDIKLPATTSKKGSKLNPDWVKLLPKNSFGEVFTVGSGECGQLGLGPDTHERVKLAKLAYFDDKQIVEISAGGQHNIVISNSGKLYSWGNNDQKALGRVISDENKETLPRPVEGLDHEFIVKVACGDSVSAALTENGRVYHWGTFRNSSGTYGIGGESQELQFPTVVEDLYYVISISCGTNHLAATTIDGRVYTWGVGEQGQLGRLIMKRNLKTEKSASLTPRPAHISTSKNAFCGAYHTFVVVESGLVYACGLNNYGQLGIGRESSVPVPGSLETIACEFNFERVVGLPEDDEVVSITGGEHHSLALTKSGRIYAFGRGDSNQTGFEDTKPLFTATLNSTVPPAEHISCGASFSMAVTRDISSSGNNLYMWGYGDMNQLANSNEGDIQIPEQTNLNNRIVYSAEGGGQHTLFLLKPKN